MLTKFYNNECYNLKLHFVKAQMHQLTLDNQNKYMVFMRMIFGGTEANERRSVPA